MVFEKNPDNTKGVSLNKFIGKFNTYLKERALEEV
jgi:hypothetical protein